MQLPTKDEINALPKDGGPDFNRLIFEDSLYLRQYARQAIQWYPWGQAAFDLAKITNKPLFLSIGYSSCHWCHVMSQTTFDHPGVAEKLNQHFVSIKIDKDQFPDIDQVYMAATQLLTQHGGWPNSVFCLPTGQPFYAGTYFPPDDNGQQHGFLTILDQLAGAWQHQPNEVKAQAQELERVIIKMNSLEQEPYQQLKSHAVFDQYLSHIQDRFDSTYGGFGTAPKFPPFATLQLLLQVGHSDGINMVEATCTSMALSGLYDYVDGGFHRYSTDVNWHLPHFEKLLQDNAQMISLYSLAFESLQRPLYQRIVTETIQHLLDYWQLDNGLFLAALDADTLGDEGRYYMMSYDELAAVCGDDDVADWATYFQFTPDGNVVDEKTGEFTGQNVFHPVSEDAPQNVALFKDRVMQFRRDHREYPAKDSRVILSANALLVIGFLTAGRVFGVSDWVVRAEQLLSITFEHCLASIDRVYVNDVIYLLRAVLMADPSDSRAMVLWDIIMDRFYDHGQGGVWFSQESHRTPITRIKDGFDRSEPAPNAWFISLALDMHQQLNQPRFLQKAIHTIVSFLPAILAAKHGCDSFWQAMHKFWSLFGSSSDTIAVQFAFAKSLGDDLWDVTLDLRVTNYILASKQLSIKEAPSAEWLQFTIDPVKTRRLKFLDAPASCATGVVRIQGRVRMTVPQSIVTMVCEVCSTDQELDPVYITVPLI